MSQYEKWAENGKNQGLNWVANICHCVNTEGNICNCYKHMSVKEVNYSTLKVLNVVKYCFFGYTSRT